MSNDRVFQALEEALPWSQSRKLRHEQQAKIKVPTPAMNPRLTGRAGRMVKPYARSRESDASVLEDIEMGEADKPTKTERLLEGLVEKRQSAKKLSLPAEARDDNTEALPKSAQHISQKDTDPKRDTNASATVSFASLLPPLSSIQEDAEPIEPLPFALLPASNIPSNTSSSITPDQSQSFLRERRTRTSAVHASSVPRRPASHEKRPNRFAMDDDEGADDSADVDAEDAELKSWASNSGIALEVPVGWSFGGASGSTSLPKMSPEFKSENALKDATSDLVRISLFHVWHGPSQIPLANRKAANLVPFRVHFHPSFPCHLPWIRHSRRRCSPLLQ